MTWDELHMQDRHRLLYPSEAVVRWLSGLRDEWHWERTLDIGCGAGRHVKLMRELGFRPVGVDASVEAIRFCNLWHGNHTCSFRLATADSLPFEDETFGLALAWGVYYYGTPEDAARSIAELARVLKPGGRALVNVRSPRDWRADRLDNEGRLLDGPEQGMEMHFLHGRDIADTYGGFSWASWELSEYTQNRCADLNSDWLIEVTR